MLRDPREVAINDLVQLCEEAAELYEQSAHTVTEDAELAALFGELAENRMSMARELKREVRQHGELPRDADPDLAAAKSLLLTVKTALSADSRQAAIDDCEQADMALAARMREAEALDHSPACKELLQRMHYEVTAALGRLAAARARL